MCERSLGGRRPPGIARLVAGQDVEQCGGVCDRPGDRTGGREALERRERRGGDPPSRRLEAEDAATGGGNPDRAASVGAVGERHEPRRERRRGPSAGAAGRALRVPGVPGVAVELRLGERDRAELRGVRLAEDDEAGVAQPADDRGVEVGDVVGERATRVRRSDAFRRGQVLDRNRDAVKRASVVRGIGSPRVSERPPRRDGDERVQLGIEPLDSLEVELGELDRGDVSVPDEPSLLGRREERELSVGHEMARAGLEPATPRFSAVCSTS